MTQSGYSAAAPGPVDSEGHVSGIRVGNPATGHSNSMGKDEMPNCGEEALAMLGAWSETHGRERLRE